MMPYLKRLFRKKYNPVNYWNTRTNPNNAQGESPQRVRFDVGYIGQGIDGLDPVLELGPGVGRTFSAYSEGQHVTTLDISHKYANRLSDVADSMGLHITQHQMGSALAAFPFDDRAFPVGVASQVLLHVPPDSIRHTLGELIRVCEKVVVITHYSHGAPVVNPAVNHVFNHDYLNLCTDLGCAMHDVIMNESRICFTLRKL